jgi:hypothetical protein
MAVKRRPVVGVLVIVPGAETAAKCSVSMLSVEEQTLPTTNLPLKHSTSTVCGPGNTVPVRSAPAGLRIVWFANRVMSNALRPSEFWMNTETRS